MRGLVDPSGDMTAFYQALWRTEAKVPGAVTRVLHYGDSPVTADSITADARSILQQRFGDAGHGFVLIAKPWAWYGHRGIKLSAQGWNIEPASQSRARDGLHGLGGVSFTGAAGAVQPWGCRTTCILAWKPSMKSSRAGAHLWSWRRTPCWAR